MSRFEIITHTIVASHLREYPRATISAFTNVPALRLVVNQYVPRGRTTVPGDISIIFCHANGLHKVRKSTAELVLTCKANLYVASRSYTSLILTICLQNLTPLVWESVEYGRQTQHMRVLLAS